MSAAALTGSGSGILAPDTSPEKEAPKEVSMGHSSRRSHPYAPPKVLVPDTPEQVVNYAKALDGSKSYLEAHPFLDMVKIQYHNHLHILICICGKGIHPAKVVSHATTHNITLSKNQQEELKEGIQTLVLAGDEALNPPPGGPPVELLHLVEDGYCCSFCDHCTPESGSMKTHWYTTHKMEKNVRLTERYHSGTLQTLFSPGRWYFRVEPMLKPISSSALFARYMKEVVPQLPSFATPEAQHGHEVPLLLQTTHWHTHLKEYVVDKGLREHLLSLTAVPRQPGTSGYDLLGPVTLLYLKQARARGNDATLGMRCMLMQYPR